MKERERKKKRRIFTFGGSVFNLGFGFSGICIRDGRGRERERSTAALRESNKKRARVKLRGGRGKLIWAESLIKRRRQLSRNATTVPRPCKIISSPRFFHHFPPVPLFRLFAVTRRLISREKRNFANFILKARRFHLASRAEQPAFLFISFVADNIF